MDIKRDDSKIKSKQNYPLYGPGNSNYVTKMAVTCKICKIFVIAYVNTALQRLMASNTTRVKSRLAADR